jgi:putative membrane protein
MGDLMQEVTQNGTKKDSHRLLKAAVAGAAAGLVASFVMDQFQAIITSKKQGTRPAEAEPASVKAAAAISDAFGYPLSKQEKKNAGPLMHYAMSAASGAFYGALAEVAPIAAAGGGSLFGTALWAVADEIAVPKLGLSKSPNFYPASQHGHALASHIVYGWTSNFVKKLVLRVL